MNVKNIYNFLKIILLEIILLEITRLHYSIFKSVYNSVFKSILRLRPRLHLIRARRRPFLLSDRSPLRLAFSLD